MASSLSLAPLNYFFINFITFTLFFLFLIKKSDLNKNKSLFFIYGWLFGFGYFSTNLYWISISLTFDQNFKFLIPLTIFLIPFFLGTFYGLVSYIFIILKPKNLVSSLLVFSLIFGIVEFIRGTILTGFPWNLIVYSLTSQLEILSITSIIGTYGLNLICITFFTCPVMLILKKTKKDTGFFIFFLIIIPIFYFYGHFYKERFYKSDKKIYQYKVRTIGSNISLDRFYSETDTISIVNDLIKLSNPNDSEKTIFVWPEGILQNISEKDYDKYKTLFIENFSANHFVIIGTNNQSIIEGNKEYFNSLSIYDNEFNLLEIYNKNNLVPFGEFLPIKNVLEKIGLKTLTNNYNSFSKGNKREIIEINKNKFSLKILPLICYEIIYTGRLFEDSKFDIIINISEDGWFGNSFGPKQHFDHSILRAIESGKYVVRSSNNGIAAIINPLGIIEQSVSFGQSGYIDLNEKREIQPTIFSVYGNKIFGLLILMYIFIIFSFNKIKNE